MLWSWWAVLAAFLLPSLATGAEVEVSYLIARTPMQQSAAAATPITFTLHADAACSGPPIRTVVSQLKDLSSHDVLREVTPGRKPSNARRLVVKFPEVRPDEAPFVRATGQGIFPAGVACQMWHRAGQGTVHSTATELRERMVPAGAARAKPDGAETTPATEAPEKTLR
jgi:hypothetical protein